MNEWLASLRSASSEAVLAGRLAWRLGSYGRAMASADPSPTPNPNAMKFTLDVTLDEMVDVRSADAAAGNPLAERIFAIPGVVMLFGTADFLTVSREEGADWDTIVPAVVAVIAEEL